MDDLESFAKLAQALAPWRQQLIFIGGWGHRLHRFHPRANKPDYQAVYTRDSDLAFANREVIEGDIKQALVEHGFQEKLIGDDNPAAAHYTLGDEEHGFYAEFLTPLTGSGIKRTGKPDATMEKAGISAQKIRDLDILLVDPWVITLGPDIGIPLPEPMDVRVANPLCFMVQKFLIQADRKANKRAQDILYIHDTIELFGAMLDEFNTHWHESVERELGKSANEVRILSAQTFAHVSDLLRDASRIPADRNLAPERLQQACKYAFEQILR